MSEDVEVKVEESGVEVDKIVITKPEHDLLMKAKVREDKLFKEQIRYEQEFKLFKFEKEEKMMENLIELKNIQLASSVLETSKDFVSGVKHQLVLENEKFQVEVQKKNLGMQLDALKREMDEMKKLSLEQLKERVKRK